MESLYSAYVILGVTVLILAMAAGMIKRILWLSEPLVAMLVGVSVGPLGADLLSISPGGTDERVLEELARLTLAISLMGVAFRLPDRWIRRRWRSLVIILLLGMPIPGIWSALNRESTMDLLSCW